MARNLQLTSSKDLIVAPATGPGAAAIAIVRASGPGALKAAARVFSRDPRSADPGRMLLGSIRKPDGSSIDQCLCVSWKAPNSYTGEDMVEFHLHGSPAVVATALAALTDSGARLAAPGEFTRRAYLNGKLDLAQAEAVSDLTQAQTDDARRAALSQLGGGLSAKLESIRRQLITVTAELEAAVDYPEEEIPPADLERLGLVVNSADRELRDLIDSSERGRRLRDGARVVFAGAPNAGKSSLFNVLLKRERAIVTAHAGTTRDVIEAVVDLSGVPLTLLDTAGLRPNPEEVEALGIQRSREEIQSADLVLLVVDVTQALDAPTQEYHALAAVPHLVLFNKCETMEHSAKGGLREQFKGNGKLGEVFVSATSRTGIDEFEELLVAQLCGKESTGDTLVTNGRHVSALREASASLGQVSEGMAADVSAELIVIDLQTALSQLDLITGNDQLDEEILDLIFSTFCLGK